MKISKKILAAVLSTIMVVGGLPLSTFISASASEEETMNYLRIKNQKGPSGVALGGTGVGYYEIDPTGRVTRTCVNNIHKNFVESPKGMMVAAYDNGNAVRLQRDGNTEYGLKGFNDSYHTGLWPRMNLDFEDSNNGTENLSFSAYSGVVAHDIKNSSLPVVYYEVTLKNTSSSAKNMSAMLSWSDVIGRGIRDSYTNNPSDLNAESGDWHFMTSLPTYAKGVTVSNGGTTYKGVIQYSKQQFIPRKVTFQEYNTSFMILADTQFGDVSIIKNFGVNDQNAFNGYKSSGRLNNYDENEVGLSSAQSEAVNPTNASAVAISGNVPANSEKKVKFMISWFMPEYSQSQINQMAHFNGCDYNNYYHNFFPSSHTDLVSYAIGQRDYIYNGILEWQQPILDSSMPSWLKYKQINSGYTFYSNGVLNKRGNFSSLEGGMGGLGGTMDQKMSSFPFYEKLFPQLNMAENEQYTNVRGSNGEIQHFDIHYYHGMSDSDPNNANNPTPNGSMIDNTGSWMLQMWNYYQQTNDSSYLIKNFNVMKTSMAFIQTNCFNGTNIPNYYTTYDDYGHPPILIFSGIVYLNMLDIGSRWATLAGDTTLAKKYDDQYKLTYADVEKLYGNYDENSKVSDFYAFGSDYEYISSNKKSGSVLNDVMFSGAMAGQFMSRYIGMGDIVPFDNFVSHMSAFLGSAVQNSNDYYTDKVYNIPGEFGQDMKSSRCWPFYLDSYGGMAAIQAGYLEDGLEILLHTMLVNYDMGYTWSQNLWLPGYETYMTTTVSWFINDVLAGSSINAVEKTLTFGPSTLSSDGIGVGNGLKVTVYYPKYWAEIDYQPSSNKFTYKIIKTFYEQGEQPLEFNKVKASPVGKATDSSEIITLNSTFKATQGAVLDLSDYVDKFEGENIKKTLLPVEKYNPDHIDERANGTGLSASVYKDYDVAPIDTFSAININYTYNPENPPAQGVTDKYMLSLDGSLLPKYGQKYQIIIEYTGDLSVTFNGKYVDDGSSSIDDVESKQFQPTPGCKLFVFTRNLNGGELYPINVTQADDISKGYDCKIRMLWWSTTQQMSLVSKERMYPKMDAFGVMDSCNYNKSDARIEDGHLAYTKEGTYATYKNVDFGGKPQSNMTLTMNLASPFIKGNCEGGTLDIMLDGLNGKKIGWIGIVSTSSWTDFREHSTNISLSTPISGYHEIAFIFHPASEFLCNITTFSFHSDNRSTNVQSSLEWFDGRNFSDGTVQIENGTHVAYTKNATYAHYENINFGRIFDKKLKLVINTAAPVNDVCNGGKFEVRLDSIDGKLLGECESRPTGQWENFTENSYVLDNSNGIIGNHSIYFVFRPKSDFLLNYTTFRFENILDDGVNFKAFKKIIGQSYSSGTVETEQDYIEYTRNNSFATYNNIDFGANTYYNLKFYINGAAMQNVISDGGSVEIRRSNKSGELLGELEFTPTGTWTNYKKFYADISSENGLTGLVDICLVFKSKSDVVMNYTDLGFETIHKYGDVDFNDKVEANDALLTLQHSISSIELNKDQKSYASVSSDGNVNAIDALLILRHSISLINSFPVEQ